MVRNALGEFPMFFAVAVHSKEEQDLQTLLYVIEDQVRMVIRARYNISELIQHEIGLTTKESAEAYLTKCMIDDWSSRGFFKYRSPDPSDPYADPLPL